MNNDRTKEFKESTSAALAKMKEGPEKDAFVKFSQEMVPFSHLSKGQLFQDLWAWWETGKKSAGYFVEFGAATGVRLSNTYYLEKAAHWNGAIAEPHPKFQESIRSNRSCFATNKCVYKTTGAKLEFLAAKAGELSRLADVVPDDGHERQGKRDESERIVVDTISLLDLLNLAESPEVIDYMSVDTEGSEFDILDAFDFSRYRIDLISVEHNKTPMRSKIYELLRKNGYSRKWEQFSRFDDWYVLRK